MAEVKVETYERRVSYEMDGRGYKWEVTTELRRRLVEGPPIEQTVSPGVTIEQ